MWFTDTSRGKSRAQDPRVIRFGERYLLYYLLAPKLDDSDSHWRIAIAESQDLESWTKVVELDAVTEAEKAGIVAGSLLVHENRVHLFYYTYGNGKDDAICYAVSDDGVTFQRAPGNPVFRAEGDWNSNRATNPCVIPIKNGYRMYFCSRDVNMEKQFILCAEAESVEAFPTGDWRQIGPRALFLPELEWEHDSVECPTVIHQGDSYFMFYGGGFHNQPQQIGCATSKDGLQWERLGDSPWLPIETLPDGAWREYADPCVFRDEDGKDYLFVQVTDNIGLSWHITYFKITWQDGLPLCSKA